MIATVDSMIRFSSKNLHPKALEILRRDLTFPNPEYVNRLRFNRWVGSTPEEISLLESNDDGTLSIPRGAVGVLRNALSKVGEPLSFNDNRVLMKPVVYRFPGDLRDYQKDAVYALVKRVQGCVVMPCGSGKTRVGIAAISRIGQPAIILVHTKDLLDQWIDTICDTLSLKAGVIAEGKIQVEDVTVGMIQTLITSSSSEITSLGKRFGTVILEESHHVPANVFRSVLSNFAGKYRFGLTATPERADGLSPLLELCIGPVVFEIDHTKLVEDGHLIIPEVISVVTGCHYLCQSYSAMITSLIKDTNRNALIVDIAARDARVGKTVLVLSGRVDHCCLLAKVLCSTGIKAKALTGKLARAERGEILDRFRTGDFRVVCATSLADEGLDVASLECLILATPARAEGRTIQRLGRLMRPYPGKGTPILYDLVDDGPMARRQHSARLKAYRKVLGQIPVKTITISDIPRYEHMNDTESSTDNLC